MIFRTGRFAAECGADRGAPRFFYAHHSILLDRGVSIFKRKTYLNAVLSSVVRFGSGDTAICNSQLATLDAPCRKLRRSIAGPPSEVD